MVRKGTKETYYWKISTFYMYNINSEQTAEGQEYILKSQYINIKRGTAKKPVDKNTKIYPNNLKGKKGGKKELKIQSVTRKTEFASWWVQS